MTEQAMTATDRTIDGFLDEVAAGEPAPGGGGSAALAGALAAALVAMAARTTVGKSGYEHARSSMRELISQAEARRATLRMLITEDERAYGELMRSYRRGKDGTSGSPRRSQAIQTALQAATEVPWRVAVASADTLSLAERAVRHGNHNALADLGVAAQLASAAARGALLTVAANLRSQTDDAVRQHYDSRRRWLLETVQARHQAVRDELEARSRWQGWA